MTGEGVIRRAVQLVVRYLPPKGRGLRLVDLVDRRLPPTGRLFRASTPFRTSISCDLRSEIDRAVYYRGTYEDDLTAVVGAELRAGDTFLDGGANIGWFSHLAARAVAPNGHVHAFEPSAALASRLESDLARSGVRDRVTVHRFALDDRTHTTRLAPDATAPGATARQRIVTDDVAGSTTIEAVALDEYLPGLRPAVIKLDVEGAELRALRGMERILREASPRLVVVEALPDQLARYDATLDDVLSFMAALGYAGRLLEQRYWAPMYVFRPR